jgi:hypothetical protein
VRLLCAGIVDDASFDFVMFEPGQLVFSNWINFAGTLPHAVLLARKTYVKNSHR